mgnify:CR=1 FL=1
MFILPKVIIKHIDAFSAIPEKGNPAGVVLSGKDFSDIQMQAIAAAVGFNETAFVLPSTIADFQIRYFTPGHENNLCGHATIGTIFALLREGKLDKKEFMIETKAGVLPISIYEENHQTFITMQHAAPQFVPFEESLKTLAEAIGLQEQDIDTEYGNLDINRADKGFGEFWENETSNSYISIDFKRNAENVHSSSLFGRTRYGKYNARPALFITIFRHY